MSFWTGIGILISIALTLILVIVALVIWFKKEEEEYEDKPFAINLLSKYTDGAAYGIEQEVIVGKGNRRIIKLSQRDLPPKEVKDMKKVPIIVEKNKIITIPKGVWSKKKNINIYLPASATDLPEGLKNTELGAALALITELKNSENTEIDALKVCINRQTKYIKEYGGGEASRKMMTKYSEVMDDLLTAIKKSKGEDGRFTPPPFSNPPGA